MHYEYLLGHTTIREIVRTTCEAIWNILQPLVMPEKTEDDWLRIAHEFNTRTNFPHCIGAVDGKHIRILRPDNSGSRSFNYKGFFSTVLMAVVDADYCFISIDVGAYGASSDSNIFKQTHFYKRLQNNLLHVPRPEVLPGDKNGRPIPFVLVGDEAFALSEHILRPYPQRNLNIPKRVFNYRLTRAGRMVECSFGIMSNKWRIFHRAIDVEENVCDIIVKACCILHNFVRKRDGLKFEDTLYDCPLDNMIAVGTRANTKGTELREYLSHYFVSPQGSLHWQYDKI